MEERSTLTLCFIGYVQIVISYRSSLLLPDVPLNIPPAHTSAVSAFPIWSLGCSGRSGWLGWSGRTPPPPRLKVVLLCHFVPMDEKGLLSPLSGGVGGWALWHQCEQIFHRERALLQRGLRFRCSPTSTNGLNHYEETTRLVFFDTWILGES